VVYTAQMSSLFDVNGKVVLVTGGSRGIGEMIARGFVEAGAKVYISSRKAEVCDALAKELSRSDRALPYRPTSQPKWSVSVSRTRFWRAKTISTSW